MIQKFTIGISVLLFTLSSCTKKLSREDALSIIKSEDLMKYQKEFSEPLFESYQTTYFIHTENQCSGVTLCAEPWITSSNKTWNMVSEVTKSKLSKLESKKYLALTDSTNNESCCVRFYKSINILPPMHEFGSIREETKSDFFGGTSKNTFLTFQTRYPKIDESSLQLKVITDGKMVEAEFRVSFELNPLGQLLYSGTDHVETSNWIATIEMYDSGWQLTSCKKK